MAEMKWWQSAVFYQIYPRSFADGNGDGIGDLKGMTARLDYLKDLGVDALWLSPHYPSPMADCGYDISSYVDVAPEYGSLDDFRCFLDEAHRRGMRVVLDLVLNHTSDQHPWFLESRSSRDNPKRDWYIWRDGNDGSPPNNWYSAFGGPAWQWDETTRSYYYHFFFKEQPDLNWRNPQVKQAMWDVVRFWLGMGVDGFRLDAIGTIYEEEGLPDQQAGLTLDEVYRLKRLASTPQEQALALEKDEQLFRHQHDLPGMHELMRELRAVVDEYDDRVLIGETDEIAYYGNGRDELHLVFNFPLMHTGRITPAWVRANQTLRLGQLPPGAWPCNTLGNHDSPRLVSRYRDGIPDGALARLALAAILTLQGTPFLYNGDEIGMTDFPLSDLSQFKDLLGVWAYHMEIDVLSVSPPEALAYANHLGRDKCRTPLQWANRPNGGFSPKGVATWLPVNPNFAEGVNVADQAENADSLLNFYRQMLRVRKNTPALIAGDYRPLAPEVEGTLAFLRSDPESGQTCLVILNMIDQAATLQLDLTPRSARRIFSNRVRAKETDDVARLTVAPYEIYIGELKADKFDIHFSRFFKHLLFFHKYHILLIYISKLTYKIPRQHIFHLLIS